MCLVCAAIVLGHLCEIASFVSECIVLSTHEISISDQKINRRPCTDSNSGWINIRTGETRVGLG